MRSVIRLCDRTTVLHFGCVLAEGTQAMRYRRVELRREDQWRHAADVGSNGVGKTSLMNTICGW